MIPTTSSNKNLQGGGAALARQAEGWVFESQPTHT